VGRLPCFLKEMGGLTYEWADELTILTKLIVPGILVGSDVARERRSEASAPAPPLGA
jgi:hypothetical protein